jgi:hypothetical protein
VGEVYLPLLQKDLGNFRCRCWVLYEAIGGFGWKNGSMCQEYISSSKPAILGMASRLGGFEALSQDSLVEVDVEKDTLDIKPLRLRSASFWRRIPKCMPWLALSLCLCLRVCKLEWSQPSGFCAYCEWTL